LNKTWLKSLTQIDSQDRPLFGGKAFQLAQMHRMGLHLPRTRCLSKAAYDRFVDETGLRERIQLEVNRKPFQDMRWEEIWDCATRIRHLFLKTSFPERMQHQLLEEIRSSFKGRSVAVRSSAPEEDHTRHSFAGLHESFINLQDPWLIVDHIRKVWASLWSDAALLYRQELNLSAEKSAMAVVIQETVAGSSSGVVFTRNPNAESQTVIEAVHGLNQGLVDGAIEPDRWVLARSNGRIIRHEAARRDKYVVTSAEGCRKAPLPQDLAALPPLQDNQVKALFDWAMAIEKNQNHPQDIEWTLEDNQLILLQTRPVSTLRSDDGDDRRKWYLSLHRSFENLSELRIKIEGELIPEMIRTAARLGQTDLSRLSEKELEAEIQKRWEINHRWVNIYWADFIPFAHGVRLFGQVYNDTLRPDDPYEFVGLLTRTGMLSMDRNQRLSAMAEAVRNAPRLAEVLKNGQYNLLPPGFRSDWDAFIEKFGDLSCGLPGATQCDHEMTTLAGIVLEMAAHRPDPKADLSAASMQDLQQAFLECFDGTRRQWAADLLDLARASYQLRDDDNIHLGRIEARLLEAVNEGRKRLQHGSTESGDLKRLKNLLQKLDPTASPKSEPASMPRTGERIQARQLVGQPAGPGVVNAKARVIEHPSGLTAFKHGEILVCDAVDPNMTFVIPLASGVIERRGGMLIHGAIIAREYGLPCVTGVSGVMDLVQTGDRLTVDGYLGIVTVH
jgi:pyruvate,water dikinase